ncbi:bifunctional histidinol-phosphatase/imidazoleglycerol-phosphate dehydratase HisB [Coralloluteibacterium stylophorae]|uniref:Histidine biosynthesis bifunctional protein HisB n=1 Tax=Coralloluteibacterium stylophorae TaxID=1776034 RepID=A0A8J7VSI3_9GAMM|nr:bifunctional histidinol-phosphatase/imidazoleglycerol-phosphate dehydratase HisB [Coralloluteibacterium stylophorae]MBS7455887.1 bifunctional histidinol-phosphatase/imidazoleglycerol-phosphate dehydratase HisB [Coralloluteibacterium stylophorae]
MRKILFVDRDGTLIHEPDDFQIDRFEKIRFVDGMLPALLKLQEAGYSLVMVSNQDGLGTDAFPQITFDGPHQLLMQLLESQGVRFDEVLIDPSLPADNSPNRKPGTGMLRHFLGDDGWSRARSAVIGDRDSDVQLAANLGVRAFRIGPELGWPQIVHALVNAPRTARVERRTKETRIVVDLDLDRAAEPQAHTGLGYFDHMLEQIGKHAGIALTVRCEGDLHVDEHHTVEDCALALGQALRQALEDKRGIGRYGDGDADGGEAGVAAIGAASVRVPMDESHASAALDLSGRPYFVFEGHFPRERVGELPTELVPHFFRSLCETGLMSLHLSVRGENAHHMVEGCFKAVARALRTAVARSGSDLPSTKGAL